MRSPLLTLSLVLTICIPSVQAYTAADIKSILDSVVNVNNPNIRPVRDHSSQTRLTLTIYPLNILNFDEVEQRLKGTMYLKVTWYDELLTWDPSLYNYTYKVDPDPKYVWKPDLVIANSYNAIDTIGGTFVLLHLYNYGQVDWYPGVMFDVFCEVDVSKYPFDTQTCYLEFVSWGTSSFEVNLTSVNLSLKSYLPNGEWQLIETWAISSYGELSSVRAYMKLRRYPTFIFVSTILPVFLLVFLNSVVFLIPVESGEKISYAITVLLSLAVFLSYITEQMPRTSTVAASTVVIALQMTLSSVYIVLSTIILRIYHRKEDDPLPRCLARLARVAFACPSRTCKTEDLDRTSSQNSQVSCEEEPSWKQLAVVLDSLCYYAALSLSVTLALVYFCTVVV